MPLLSDLNLGIRYSTSRNDLIEEFYQPCLDAAVRYDRAVGYFRSTLYILVGLAYSSFAQRNGKVRIVCSPQFAPDDIDALRAGYDARDILDERLTDEVRSVLADPVSRPVTEFLATLVACGALDLKVAFRHREAGIFHDKLGIFQDAAGQFVTFTGSANETFSAWDLRANHESFDVFRSWGDEFQRELIETHLRDFGDLWGNVLTGIDVRPFPDAAREHLLTAAVPAGVDDAARAVRHVVRKTKLRPNPAPQKQASEVPKQTIARVLQPHQAQVVAGWLANRRGIIDHVTGAGKTISALAIIKDWVRTGRPVLVLVPSELLALQWRREILTEISDATVIVAGAGNPQGPWAPVLPDLTRDLPDLGPRIVVATLATASSETFLRLLGSGDHLLVVADEVHRVGSAGHRSVLGIKAGGALGLSATPERYGDPVGTTALFAYFGDRLKPSFGISEAIAAGRLVPYDYYVHTAELTDEEQEEWDRLTERIKRSFAGLPRSEGGERIHTEAFRRLLYRRASILKQADGKVHVARDVLQTRYRENDRWLVYCDDQAQLREVYNQIADIGLPVYEYHSSMEGARSETLDHFTRRGGVLVAIRCLDEGVDLPLVNKALILASSTNLREFIQRRGRVLRSAPGKYSAEIHDVLVVPHALPQGTTDDDTEHQATLLRPELRRAAEFAKFARNTSESVSLWLLAQKYNIDDFELVTSNAEED